MADLWRNISRTLAWLAIPNLTKILLFGQVATYALEAAKPDSTAPFYLFAPAVLDGEVWRLVTFLFVARSPAGPIQLIFDLLYFYALWFTGSRLEATWGAPKFNLFVLLGMLFTIAAAFAFPLIPIRGFYLSMSFFLAFAWYYPDLEFRINFIIPVKAKYLAWFYLAVCAFQCYNGPNAARAFVLASIGNCIVFLGPDILRMLWRRVKGIKRTAELKQQEAVGRHRCVVCQKTDKSHPNMEFRYCNRCTPTSCYCEDHVLKHEHLGS